MDVLYQSCAGIDVHQANIVVCILHGPLTSTRPKCEKATFDTRTKGLRACHDFLSQFHVEAVLVAKSTATISLTTSSQLSNEITTLLKDSEITIFEQGKVANYIIELSMKK